MNRIEHSSEPGFEGKIQERYGIAKDQARKDVDTWFKTMP
jgi:uncharacterized protein YjbJ (UPF0337 family)